MNKNFLPSYEKLKDVVSIIDYSEIFIEQPKTLAAHTETWSNYKYLIEITPSGAVVFLSTG